MPAQIPLLNTSSRPSLLRLDPVSRTDTAGGPVMKESKRT